MPHPSEIATTGGGSDLPEATGQFATEDAAGDWLDYDDSRTLELLYATNRAKADGPLDTLFSGERSRQLSFGLAAVRIPENHRLGVVERPLKISILSLTLYEEAADPRRHFILAGHRSLSAAKWGAEVERWGAEEALVFVHGFNVGFAAAIYKCAQIVWDLKYRGVPIVFSWPSRGRIADYEYDRESALASRGTFLRVLSILMEQPSIKKVHILAHSMGNQVVLEALAGRSREKENFRIGELMMAAPDVDRDVYSDIAPKVRDSTAGMTLYASSRDKALALSKRIAGRIPRAGDVPKEGPIVIPKIDSIDASALGTEILGLNHGTYAQARSILNDIFQLLSRGTRPPKDRLADIRGVPDDAADPLYWRYQKTPRSQVAKILGLDN